MVSSLRLLEPVKVGPLELRNRIVMPAITERKDFPLVKGFERVSASGVISPSLQKN